jgi:radical SAM superfamily enzyme YgiQ (UPF0313 family)
MRMTLIYPSVGRKPGLPYVRAWQMEPLSMALLASLTPPEVDLRFYDDRMETIPFDEPTDLVAISVETFTALRAYRLAKQFRDRGIPVVMGGYHVTLCPDEASQMADSIVIGDADEVWSQMLTDFLRGDLQAEYRSQQRTSLDGLRPRREIFAGKDYQNLRLVEFARGCNFKCDFCSITAFHAARQTHRPAAEVAAEMAAIGGSRFFIVDDNFVSQPEQARQLCRELVPLGVSWVGQASIHIASDTDLLNQMAASGCRGVLIGLESLSEGNLRQMGKQWNTASGSYADSLRRFRDAGLAVYGTFVFGYDDDSPDTIKRSVEFACQQKLFLAAFNQLIPFPGTPLYRRLLAEGRLIKPTWWLDRDCRVGDVVFRPARMQPEELQQACLDARRDFFKTGAIVQRMTDFRANLRTPLMAAIFLGLNWQGKYDIDLRQGMRLGAGLQEEELFLRDGISGSSHEPLSV